MNEGLHLGGIRSMVGIRLSYLIVGKMEVSLLWAKWEQSFLIWNFFLPNLGYNYMLSLQ